MKPDLKIYRGDKPEYSKDEVREAMLYMASCLKLGITPEQAIQEYFNGKDAIDLNQPFVNERNEH